VTGFTLACLFLSKCFRRPALLKGATRGDFAKIFQQQNWKHRFYRKWILSSDRMIAISQEMKEELLACGIPANKIIRIPNAVRSEKFSPASIERKTSLRKNLSAVIDQFVVLYLGRLEGRKGLDILLKAWQMKSPGALWIVGEGPEREKLKALAADLNLSNVHFYAQTKSPLEFYQAADLFVLPSLREGLPGALLEAMSCGLPCIATQIGGVIDVMEDHKQGLLVPAASVPDLADAIEHATYHPDDRIQWARQARETIVRSFDMSRISSVYFSLFRSLLSDTGKSRFR
jgi:glycosyltransferase involved in cell wall biosynthesis